MDDREAVRRGYDELAGTYAERRTGSDRERAVLGELLDSLPERPRVLDAGCGQGTPVLERLDREATAVGVDLSRGQLRLAAGAVPGAALVQGDLTGLPFRDDAFDAVVAVDSVIHLPLADHPTAFGEFARVLRSGGRLLLSEAPEERRRTTADWLGEGVEMRWRMAGAAATRRQLRDAGFRLTAEWEAPDAAEDGPPRPPFFAATLAR